MAIIKPEQLSSGTYSISGSFSGSFHGDGSDLNNLPSNVISTGSYADFPDTGSEGYIYIDNSANIGYLWDSGSIPPTYVNIAGPSTPPEVLPLAFANAATVLALLPSPLYNNGISGSGAVLTGSINGVLSDNSNPGKIDYVYTPIVGDVILVKNQPTGSQNGLYTITSTGSVSSKYVLTRTDEYDISSELFPLQVNILAGTNNKNKSFIQSTANPVIGTSSLVFSAASPATSFSPQIAFVDTVIDTPLTNIVYATGSFSTLVPGNGATITSTVPGTLGTWNGLSVNTNQNITGSFTKALVINQTNPAYNGDYSVLATGSATVFWKLQRINNNASGFDRYTRFFIVSNTSSSKAGRMYFTSPNSPVLTNATIGTAPINIFEYGGGGSGSSAPAFPFTGSAIITGSLTVTGSIVATTGFTGSLLGTASFAQTASYALNALSASWAPDTTFPYTGSALITGSLSVTGSFNILTTPTPGNTAVFTGYRMSDVAGAFFQLTNYTTSSGVFVPTIRSFHPPTSTATGLQLIAQIGLDGAANANPAMTFNVMSQSAAVGQIRNRPLFTWENNNTSSMALTTIGLAIGTNLLTPSASLHINNTSSFNSFLVEDDTRPDSSPFVIDNAGRVGIGTTTPSASLDIRASSSAATDLAFRVRNSTNTIDIISANGDGIIYKPHASPNDDNPIEIFNSQMSDGRNKISLFTKGSFNLSSAIGISFQSDAAGTTKSSYTLNGASIFAGTSYKDNAGLSEFNVGTSNVTGYSFLRLKDNGGTNTNVYISRTGTIILNPDNANAQVRGLALFGGTLGANADRVIAIGSGTSPTTSSIDSFQFWSNDIVAGNAAPHFRTEAGNVVKLYTQAAVTSSQGIADALTNLGLLTGSSVIVTTPTSGPFGISNSSGSYTYYTSFSASVAAAPTGSVVEMFADVVETGSVEVILRNNVNIFGNGHTYTLNNSGLIHAIKTTTSSNISCSINNLTVIRRGSTGSISDNAALSLGVATTGVINCAGSTFINQGSGSGINSQSGIAEINYATAIASTTWGAIGIFTSSGFRLNHSIGYGTAGGFGIRCHNGGNVSNCIGISDSGTGFYGDAGNFSNCTGVSVSGPGFSGGGGSGGSAINCTGRSTSGVGFDTTNGANVVNCTGISVSGVGLTSNITTHNCTGISNSSRGVTLTSSAIAYNITAKSISSYALLGTNTSKIYGGNIISEWNDATGYGIRGNGGGSISSVISNCVIKLANTSSPYLFNDGIAASISMKGNTYTGGAPFNPNLTQAITATQDNQGNIYL